MQNFVFQIWVSVVIIVVFRNRVNVKVRVRVMVKDMVNVEVKVMVSVRVKIINVETCVELSLCKHSRHLRRRSTH